MPVIPYQAGLFFRHLIPHISFSEGFMSIRCVARFAGPALTLLVFGLAISCGAEEPSTPNLDSPEYKQAYENYHSSLIRNSLHPNTELVRLVAKTECEILELTNYPVRRSEHREYMRLAGEKFGPLHDLHDTQTVTLTTRFITLSFSEEVLLKNFCDSILP